MGKVRACICIGLTAFVLAFIGCGGGTGDLHSRGGVPGVSANPALPDLPAPSTLRGVKVVTSGVFRYGSQYASALPHQLVTGSANRLAFAPAWLGDGVDGAAYAIYAFDSTGYTTDDTLHLTWNASGSFGDLWIGLANFSRDRWDWFPGPATGALPYDPLKYSSSGQVYAAVLCLGSDAWQLTSIRISADVPPVVISVGPLSCTAGVPAAFSATLDGTADSYNWNFGGGTNPNTSTAIAPTVTPLAVGNYHATLAVANGFGSDVFQFNLIVEPWDKLPVAVLGANPTSGDAPLMVNFDASESHDPDDGATPGAGIDLYEWDYTDDGSYDHVSIYPLVSYSYASPGPYTCRLRVTDNESNTATDTVDITVNVPSLYTVSGTVTMADAGGLTGVNLALAPGGYSGNTVASGVFAISDVVNGVYTLTPTLAGWTFSPATLPVTVSGADVAGQDVTAYSAPVADLAGEPLLGNLPLIVNFDASASNDPDNGGAAGAGIAKFEWDWENDGTFEFDSNTDATVTHTYSTQGAYTCVVRATDNESATATDTVSITVGDGTGFIAAGYVLSEYNTRIAGVTMSFTGGLASVTTDSSGFWYRDGIPDGTYTVTPSLTPYTFSPVNRDFTISGADVFLADFTGSLSLTPNTLYAIPLQATAAVGEPVRILVATGQPPNALQFLSTVGLTVENAGTYVATSFNIGVPGGGRDDTDGYWALMGPPPPANGAYQDFGDFMLPGSPTDIGGGLHRYNFAVITMGPYAAPASIGNGAVLFNFALSFSAPGTYHLGFQANDGSFDQTFYSDQNGTNYFWGTLDNSYTITVN